MEFSLRYPPVTGRLYTRYAPVRRSSAAYCYALLPLDLHVLGLPLAFILSQDQTLHCKNCFFHLWLSVSVPYNILYGTWHTLSLVSTFSMSLRFLFQQPPSGGESECKDTTIFQTTKKNFRLKTQQSGATTDLQRLETRKKFQKSHNGARKQPAKRAGNTPTNAKSAQTSAKQR